MECISPAPPPSYEAVNRLPTDKSIDTKPPSYESFVNRFRSRQYVQDIENVENENRRESVKEFGMFVPCFVCVLLSTLFPIAILVMGSINLNKCAINQNIPLWLIVGSLFYIVLATLLIAGLILNVVYGDFKTTLLARTLLILIILIILFLFAWLITGTVFIFGLSVVEHNQSSIFYCDKTLYLFALWVISVSWIIFGMPSLCIGLCVIIECVVKKIT